MLLIIALLSCLALAITLDIPCSQWNRSNPVVVSDMRSDSIHRFFDTSAVSPSGQYLAYAELPSDMDGLAAVKVINLKSGNTTTIARTSAWGAQLGAQVQWSGNDDKLFFNMEDLSSFSRRAYGVSYDPRTHASTPLPCAVYHVSADGQHTVSPDLYRIFHTQRGYGIDRPNAQEQAQDDGIMVADLRTHSCRQLYSLQQIAAAIGLDSPRIYGFHTKWSSDGKYILFVLRSLEQPADSSSWVRSKVRVRVQHLVLLSADGQTIKYVLSWASKPFMSNGTKVLVLVDGNHPNWIPGSHRISMNFDAKHVLGQDSQQLWATVVIDADRLLCDLPLYHQRFRAVPFQRTAAEATSTHGCQQHTDIEMMLAWEYGFGHPSFHPNGRYFITDAYEKEASGVHCSAVQAGMIPVLLVDTLTKHVTVLAQVRSFTSQLLDADHWCFRFLLLSRRPSPSGSEPGTVQWIAVKTGRGDVICTLPGRMISRVLSSTHAAVVRAIDKLPSLLCLILWPTVSELGKSSSGCVYTKHRAVWSS